MRRLAAAGAQVLGKTNMDEFAMGSSNENSGYGPVRNPWDRERVPGGSSGGSAAAVAGRLAPWAIGTDTGGSIRQPASLCGIVGLKPTYGAISRYGMIAFASSLDQCGPLTRDVTDAALLLRAMEGRDRCDSTSVGIEGGVELPSRERPRGPSLRRAARARRARPRGSRPASRRSSSGTLGLIRELGGEVDECELPHAAHGISAYYVLAPAEASANLARYDGVRYGLREVRRTTATSPPCTSGPATAGFGAEVKRRIMLGTYALSSGYYDAYYGRAQRVRTKIAEDFATAFERFDYLVTPDLADRRLRARGAERRTRWRCTCPTTARCRCRSPASRRSRFRRASPSRTAAGRSSRSGSRSSRRRSAESGLLDAAHAIEGAIGFDARPRGSRRMSLPEGYEAVIGLEIHVQLQTRTKMFCGCALSFGDEPNVHTCPVCLAHPGIAAGGQRAGGRYALQIGAGAGAASSPRGRSSTARTTSTPTTRRATRSASTTSRWRRGAAWATSASTASTSRRTPRR